MDEMKERKLQDMFSVTLRAAGEVLRGVRRADLRGANGTGA